MVFKLVCKQVLKLAFKVVIEHVSELVFKQVFDVVFKQIFNLVFELVKTSLYQSGLECGFRPAPFSSVFKKKKKKKNSEYDYIYLLKLYVQISSIETSFQFFICFYWHNKLQKNIFFTIFNTILCWFFKPK